MGTLSPLTWGDSNCKMQNSKLQSKAFIDIGTNSVLLLIIDQNKNILADEAAITRLGEGLAQKSEFIPQAMDRTFAALEKYVKLCQQHQIDEIVAVGTAGFRKAKNSKHFVEQIKKSLGISVEIISGEKEAELTWKAASADFGENIVVIDVGGGSTEIITNLSLRGMPATKQSISLPIGSVLLTEKFCHSDPISDVDYQNLCKVIDEALPQFPSPPVGEGQGEGVLVATAGTATTLAAIDLGLKEYKHSKVHGYKLSVERLKLILAELKSKTIEERKNIPGLQPGRADVILAGALILEKFSKQLRAETIIISDRGVRWGLAMNFVCAKNKLQ